MTSLKRVMNEYKEMKQLIDSGSTDEHRFIDIVPINDDFNNMNVYFLGPKISYYEEIVHTINIRIPKTYPSNPPGFHFKNKIYHPNIGSSGEICLDILKDKWKPVYSLRTVLLSIISLLSDPNPDSPLHGEAASAYKRSLQSKDDMRKYKKTITTYDNNYKY